MYFVYVAESLKSGKIYVGFTAKSPSERIAEHNLGTNQWSRQNRPLKLIFFESYICKTDAKNREKFYKSGVGRRIRDAIIQVMK